MANSTSGPEHPLPNRIHKGKQKGRDHVGQERLHNRGIMSYWFLQQIHKDKDKKQVTKRPIMESQLPSLSKECDQIEKKQIRFQIPISCPTAILTLYSISQVRLFVISFDHKI